MFIPSSILSVVESPAEAAAAAAKKKAEAAGEDSSALDNSTEVAQAVESIESDDPWIKSKFAEAPASGSGGNDVKEI